MKVQAIKCPICKDTIFSRARHDFHGCSCGKVTVDGGFDYIHYGWNPDIEQPKPFELEVEQTEKELYDDWNLSKDKYGILKGKIMNNYLWVAKVEYGVKREKGLTSWIPQDFIYFITPPCDLDTAQHKLLEELGEGYVILSLDRRDDNVLDLR